MFKKLVTNPYSRYSVFIGHVSKRATQQSIFFSRKIVSLFPHFCDKELFRNALKILIYGWF